MNPATEPDRRRSKARRYSLGASVRLVLIVGITLSAWAAVTALGIELSG